VQERIFERHIPLRATRFHAIGLKEIEANEMRNEFLLKMVF